MYLQEVSIGVLSHLLQYSYTTHLHYYFYAAEFYSRTEVINGACICHHKFVIKIQQHFTVLEKCFEEVHINILTAMVISVGIYISFKHLSDVSHYPFMCINEVS